MNAFDVYCSASRAEAFSNSIVEAMACGVPVIATNVGDSSFIVQHTGQIVPSEDRAEMTQAIFKFCREKERRKKLATRARERVLEHFKISAIAREYFDAFASLNGDK
jgi:glycosyltransferase involved in cell wall biosynthesis